MSRPPNILHLFADQQRFDTISALGNPFIKTPALDRLAREGTSFVNAFTPSPVCVPARAAMHYGKYPWHTGCYDNGDPWPTAETPNIPSLLGGAGYRTHAIGKCHFHPDLWALLGFQSREPMEELVDDPERDDYLKFLRSHGYGHVQDLHGMRGDFYYLPQPGQLPEEAHPTGWAGRRAMEFMESAATRAQPWYLYCSFIHPHPPWVLPPKWAKLYRSNDMMPPFLPDNCDELLTFVNHFQNRYKWRDRGFDLNLLRAQRAFYHGCISFIDFQIGRLLALLDQSGQADETLVVFSSDHGEYLGDYGCYGKRGMHDVSCRIPLLARWPGDLGAGVRCQTPASLVDLMPTFADAAGVDCDSDGMSLRHLVEAGDQKRVVFSQYQKEGDALYMAADAEAKYIYSASDDKEFFFLRTTAGQEVRSTLNDPTGAAHAGSLRASLMAEIQAVEQDRGLDGCSWRKYPPRPLPSDPDDGLLFQDQPFAEQGIPGYQDSAIIRSDAKP